VTSALGAADASSTTECDPAISEASQLDPGVLDGPHSGSLDGHGWRGLRRGMNELLRNTAARVDRAARSHGTARRTSCARCL